MKNTLTEMADKIAEHLPNYASNDIAILGNAISGLSILDHTTNTKSMMDKIEESVAKFKGQLVPGLAKPEGWHPLAKMLTEIVKSGNPALQERAFACIVQLLALAKPEGISESAGDLAQLTLAVIGQQQPRSNEVRESALHALKVLLEKFPAELPRSIHEHFAELQAALLAILPDKSYEPVRQLSAQCMGQLVKFHTDPSSLFSVLSDMSDDCELMLKDDFLLDDLLEQAMGRENELRDGQGTKSD